MSIKRLHPEAVETFSIVLHPKRTYFARKIHNVPMATMPLVSVVTAVSVTPDQGDTLGGELLTIIGTGFTSATAVSVGGTAAVGLSVISDTEIIAIAPAHAAATGQSVLVTAPGGTNAANTLYEFWSPALLALTGFWERGDYDAQTATWTARASAGTSGGRNLTQATAANVPSETNLEPVFDGTDSVLPSGALTLGDLFSTSSGSLWLLFRPSRAGVVSGTRTSEEAVFADVGSAALIISYTTAGTRISLASGGFINGASILLAQAVGELHLLQAKWDGTNLYARIDGGTWSSAACGPADLGTVAFNLFANWNGGLKAAGTLRSFGVTNTLVADPTFDKIVKWAQARHGVAT